MGDLIDIKCNNCGYIEALAYGSGYFGQEHHYYYCSKCYKIRLYSKSMKDPIPLLKFKDGKIVEKIRRCKSCKTQLKPFKLKFFEGPPYIKGPVGYRCPECHSKDITYEDVGCWD